MYIKYMLRLTSWELRGTYTLSGEKTLWNLFCPPYVKRSVLKGNNLLKFFPFRIENFSEASCCAGKQTGSHKVVSLVKKIAENLLCVSSFLRLTLTRLWADSADDKLVKFFSYFSLKIGSDTSCKLSPNETICMECQILFSRKNKKKKSKCRLLKFLPSMQSVNNTDDQHYIPNRYWAPGKITI